MNFLHIESSAKFLLRVLNDAVTRINRNTDIESRSTREVVEREAKFLRIRLDQMDAKLNEIKAKQ